MAYKNYLTTDLTDIEEMKQVVSDIEMYLNQSKIDFGRTTEKVLKNFHDNNNRAKNCKAIISRYYTVTAMERNNKAQELKNHLLSSEEIARDLVKNDALKTLEIDGFNIDFLLMEIRLKVEEYQKNIQDAMAHKF